MVERLLLDLSKGGDNDSALRSSLRCYRVSSCTRGTTHCTLPSDTSTIPSVVGAPCPKLSIIDSLEVGDGHVPRSILTARESENQSFEHGFGKS